MKTTIGIAVPYGYSAQKKLEYDTDKRAIFKHNGDELIRPNELTRPDELIRSGPVFISGIGTARRQALSSHLY